MQLITEEYRSLNERLHASRDDYGRSGQRWARMIHDMATAMGTTDILDYGCGKSTLATNLPFAIHQYDPAVAKYAAPPVPADIVVCTDVLEHIEPELIGDVLDHLQSLAKKVVFLVIATRPAKKCLPDGRNAHLIVEHPRWWMAALWDRFEICNFQSMDGECLITGVPYQLPKNGASHA